MDEREETTAAYSERLGQSTSDTRDADPQEQPVARHRLVGVRVTDNGSLGPSTRRIGVEEPGKHVPPALPRVADPRANLAPKSPGTDDQDPTAVRERCK
jgi:hypothetical protein